MFALLEQRGSSAFCDIDCDRGCVYMVWKLYDGQNFPAACTKTASLIASSCKASATASATVGQIQNNIFGQKHLEDVAWSHLHSQSIGHTVTARSSTRVFLILPVSSLLNVFIGRLRILLLPPITASHSLGWHPLAISSRIWIVPVSHSMLSVRSSHRWYCS